MVEFCGEENPFWDWNRTWYTDNPDFTDCFEQTLLAWIPCALLWLMSGLDVYFCLRSRFKHIPWSPLNIAKSAITILLASLQLILLAYRMYYESEVLVTPVDRYTPIIRILTFGLALFLILFGKVKGVRSSGVQFMFWILMVFCEAFAFRTAIINSYQTPIQEDAFVFVIKMIFYPFIVCQFFLSCWADAAPEYEETSVLLDKRCPEESASFLSKILFAWFEGLAWKGYKKPLEYKDLWDLNTEDKSSSLVPIFEKYWHKSVEKTKVTNETKATFRKRSGSITFKEANKPSGTRRETSVLPTLIKSFGTTFMFGSFLKLIHDLLIFVSPQILKLLIAFVSSHGAEDDWKGYFYALLLLGASTLQTLILGQYFHRMFLVGMRMRTTLVSAIYRKALVISNAARKESTVGEIVNLMSVDAQRLMDITVYLNMLWSAPLQIGISLYFLWQTLGPSVLAGLAVMILLIPVNAVIANKVKTLQIKQMKNKDIRVKLMNEILSGIKVLKLYAWEPSFQDQVMKVRGKEMKVLKDAAYLNAGSSFVWTCAPFLVSLVTFGTYVLIDSNNILDAEKAFVALTLFNIIRMPMSVLPMMIVLSVQVAVVTFATYVYSDPANILDAERAFVSLALFNILRFPMSMFPMMISNFVQANVSIKRLNKYMSGEEIDPNAVSHEPQESDPVVVENGSFAWESETTVLKNINFHIKEGSLTAIVGPVGSGKSSLLSALLGEMEKLTGRVNTKGSIAYCGQQAWIQNATLRDNVLFGRPFDPTKYDNIVEACALKPDLEILPAGDKTEIGEKGINLSGGQKQRVSLARAAYNNADTYLLDDPLSAVDSHVGKHIFEKVIGPKGVLKRKTRLLVTHGVTFLPQVDNIIVLKDGEVSESGSYKELLDKKGAFAEFLIQHLSSESDEDEDEDTIIHDLEAVVGKKVDRQRSKISESDSVEKGIMQRQMSITSQDSTSPKRRMSKSIELSKEKSLPIANGVTAKNKLIEAEKSETGSVKISVYLHYMRAIGWQMSFWSLLMQLGFQAFSVLSNIWLSEWSNSNENATVNHTENADTDMYLAVYGAFGLGQAVTILVGSIVLGLGTLKASSVLHLEMLQRIFKAPMSFFDTTPVGRIVNRAAKDVDVCDNTLSQNIRAFLNCFFSVAATLVVISYTTPIFVSVIIPTGILYYLVQRFYVATSRQLKRLESVSRSPIYSHFGETLTGCPTIRAYGMNERFIMESESKVDHNQIAYYPSIVSNRWLAIRLETVGNFIIFFAALFTVVQRKVLDPGSVGLSLSYALNITQTLNWLVRMTSEVETNVVAVERIKEYSELPQEASWEVEERKPNSDWPEKGVIEFNEYQARYREGLELILKGISCQINSAEKIGIVGRTGSGKSTLTLSLFRIIEAAGGKIVVDGEDISKLGLHDVRGRLTIIPQDPVLFSGTLRINLDPFQQYSDETLWRALELSHLKSFVKGLSAGLQHEISEGGENLSVGQRQLICLARALLRKTKILVLDEATAAVDLETDDLIQQTIRTEFKNCTVLTIAHRLNTIMDSTRVLVLDKGEIKEFDSPESLLKNKASLFYSMAKDAGLV